MSFLSYFNVKEYSPTRFTIFLISLFVYIFLSMVSDAIIIDDNKDDKESAKYVYGSVHLSLTIILMAIFILIGISFIKHFPNF